MNYILRGMQGIKIVGKYENTETKGLKQYINTLCIENLSTYEGRSNAAKSVLGKVSLIPIYVNRNTLLFPTKSIREYSCMYLNYFNILSIRKTDNVTSVITFNDLTEVKVDISYYKLKNQLKKSNEIMNNKKN